MRKVLVIGGAGYVGSIIRPRLESAYVCRYMDLRPVEGAEDRTVVGDVNDDAAVRCAVEGQDAVVYLAMGTADGNKQTVNDIDAAFNVNVRGLYRVLSLALESGVRRFCVASSLSVYQHLWSQRRCETDPADCWIPYGMSKRVGEFICEAAAQQYPDASILVLRMVLPKNEADWPAWRYDPSNTHQYCAVGPQDTARLFALALAFDRPGCHIVQASGDLTDQRLPNDRARALLGWSPENR